jgi:hypothetical protein
MLGYVTSKVYSGSWTLWPCFNFPRVGNFFDKMVFEDSAAINSSRESSRVSLPLKYLQLPSSAQNIFQLDTMQFLDNDGGSDARLKLIYMYLLICKKKNNNSQMCMFLCIWNPLILIDMSEHCYRLSHVNLESHRNTYPHSVDRMTRKVANGFYTDIHMCFKPCHHC